jgi:CheY-like chemotaxis protein
MRDALTAPVVLIAEDEWILREEICEKFREAHWTVVEASTGEGCMAFAQKGLRIDALVTDVQLSGYTSGWDVAELFRSLDPNLPVIYASGNSIQNSRMVPGSVFFTKPCKTTELLETCERLCQAPQHPVPAPGAAHIT